LHLRQLLSVAAIRSAVHDAGDLEVAGRIVPVHLVLGVGLRAGKHAARFHPHPGSEGDLVHLVQRARVARVLGELAARLHHRVGRAGRRIAVAVVHLLDGVAIGERFLRGRRQRQAVVAEVSLVLGAGVGVLGRKGRVAFNALAGRAVVQAVTPHRHAGGRIASVAREALLAVVVAAAVVVGVVGERERGRLVRTLHFQAAGAARGAGGGHAQRLGAGAALVALLALEVGDPRGGAFEEAIERATRRARHGAAVVEAEDAVRVAGGRRLRGADVHIDGGAFSLRVVDPDTRAHRLVVARAGGIYGRRRELVRLRGAAGVVGRRARFRVAFLHVDQRVVSAVVDQRVGAHRAHDAGDHVHLVDAARGRVFDVTVLRVGAVGRIRRRGGQRDRGLGKRECYRDAQVVVHGSAPRYCALVAVTTATDVGVATPSTVAEDGGGGGGELPPGGGAFEEDPPPPHPDATTTNAMSNIATRISRA